MINGDKNSLFLTHWPPLNDLEKYGRNIGTLIFVEIGQSLGDFVLYIGGICAIFAKKVANSFTDSR